MKATMILHRCLLHGIAHELEWQQVADALDDEGAFGAIEQDFDRLLVAVLHFHDGLSAHAAGRDGLFQESVIVAGGNGYRLHWLVGMLGLGREEGHALAAETNGIGGVLLLGADGDGAVGHAEG